MPFRFRALLFLHLGYHLFAVIFHISFSCLERNEKVYLKRNTRICGMCDKYCIMHMQLHFMLLLVFYLYSHRMTYAILVVFGDHGDKPKSRDL
jgi:hypothetical protein